MPDSSRTPEPFEYDVVCVGFPPLNQETLNISDDEETPVVPSRANLHASARDVTLSSPYTRRRPAAVDRIQGNPNIKKQQAVEEKLNCLMTHLNPVPFVPHKILNFAKHEKLLRMLGLWEFVHVDFDTNIRVDLIARLIAAYDSESRSSCVDGFRVLVTRADLARAFKLPVHEKGSGAGGIEVDFEWEALSGESSAFISEFVFDWVLLHEDMWMMPREVVGWVQLIRDGHPERVDWTSLVWFMVEKEVKQGGRLTDCYYASHLQHLMKFQHKEMFLSVKSDVVEDVHKGEEIINLGEEDSCFMEGGTSTELTLLKDGEKGGGILIKDAEMMDVDKCKGNHDYIDVEEEEEEEKEGQEQRRRLLQGKFELGEHFMHPCNTESAKGFKSFELIDEDEEEIEEDEDEEDTEEEEDGDQFHDFPRNDGYEEGFIGNFLGELDSDQLGFNPQDPLYNRPSHINSIPSFINNSGKRAIEQHHSNEGNKKLRINDSELWDHNYNNNNNKPPQDFGMFMVQIQRMTERAKMLYEEKEQMLERSNTNQQLLLDELRKRDSVIDHLHKTRLEEIQKKDSEIYRLERELDLMAGVLEGYRNALKEVRKSFSEYKENARVSEEPTYKDTEDGGLVSSVGEIKKIRRERGDDFRLNCLSVGQMV